MRRGATSIQRCEGFRRYPRLKRPKRTLDLWSGGDLDWVAWLEELNNVRQEFAKLIGVSPAHVGVGHTTAALVNVVAANLKPGSRVLVPEFEHNSNTIPFVAQQYRGVTVDTAPLTAIAHRISSDYAAVALSLVQSIDGSIVDLQIVSQACRRSGTLLCLDVTQAAGWQPFDATLADVVVCSSYKWLMGPNGPAFIALRRDCRHVSAAATKLVCMRGTLRSPVRNRFPCGPLCPEV